MDDTRERFLNAIVDRLGAERIVELHLFSPIRQGVMETGVAVVAALPDLEPEAEPGEAEALGAPVTEEVVVAQVESTAQVECGVEGVQEETGRSAEEEGAGDDSASPYLDAPVEPADAADGADETLVTGIETPAESRYVVFTASYRLTRKGVDRGKWLFELAATADAPLATVDTVVRGVMLRSKDLTETERMSGEQLRAILAEPAWRTTQ